MILLIFLKIELLPIIIYVCLLIRMAIKSFDLFESHFLCHYISPKAFSVVKISIVILRFSHFKGRIKIIKFVFCMFIS